MTIILTPQTEALLREKSQREGQDESAVADALLAALLTEEAQDRAEAVAGVQEGEQAAAEGRERPLSAFLKEQRIKHNLPAQWPHESE